MITFEKIDLNLK